MAGIDDSYIVHCAQTFCSMGIRPSYVVLGESHGVFLKQSAQLTVKDVKAHQNIIEFGGCISPENPDTVAEAKRICEEVEAETQMAYGEYAVQILSIQREDGTTVMQCAGKCRPTILTTQWDKEKEDVYVDKGKRALYGKATLTCKYGGIITIETTGQPE